MLNLRICIARNLIAIILLACSLNNIETPAHGNNIQTSPFKQCWKLETDKMTPYGIASDNERHIYLPLLNGKIESINLRTGEKIWESELGGDIISLPVFDNNNIYIVSQSKADIFLRSLSKDSGITNWKVNFNFKGEIFLIKANNKLVISGKGGQLVAVDKKSGEVIWSKDSGQELSSTPILFGSQLIFGTLSKKIFFYSIENGDILSQFEISTSPSVILLVGSKYLFWGDYKGNAYLSDLITKKTLWKVRSGAEISNVLATRQGLLISSLDNFIYLISIKTGKFIWKRRFNGRWSFNSIINDRYVILVAFASEVVDIIDIENGKLLNQLTVEGNNYFINKPLLSVDLFIFPTIKGLIAFSNSRIECPSK